MDNHHNPFIEFFRKRFAHETDDQLAIFSHVGRGPKGDSYKVTIDDPDSKSETHLHGWYKDEVTGEMHSDWISENINGGHLMYQYNLRPYTIPRTFTITFIYRRPGRPEWSWTTPAIPYIWSLDAAGRPETDPDHIIGCGIATLFLRSSKDEPWDIEKHERLVYPDETTREDFNAPNPEEGWTVNITFGHGGDIDVPNFDDLSKILGTTKQQLYDILEDKTFIIDGIEAANIIDYINKCDQRDMKHLHLDMGWGEDTLIGCDPDSKIPGTDIPYTIKNYIDYKLSQLLANTIGDILNKIYGNNTIDPDTGEISWGTPDDLKIPTGNINLYSAGTEGYDNAHIIRTHDNHKDWDVRVE